MSHYAFDHVEPDLAQKHTFYAVAWDIIRLPQYEDGDHPHEKARQVARERVRIKRACRAYAKARGCNLELVSNLDGGERWNLSWWSNEKTYNSIDGSFQECCLRLVEMDIWPEGKPPDAP